MPLVQLLDLSHQRDAGARRADLVTTFLALLRFLFFGGEVICGFALAMSWGVVDRRLFDDLHRDPRAGALQPARASEPVPATQTP